MRTAPQNDRTAHQRLAGRLAFWQRHPGFRGSAVRLVASTAGSWHATPHCATPRLWILLCGHLRTFAWTRSSLAEIAARSSADCYFVAAAVPLQIEATLRTGFWSPVAPSSAVGTSNDAAEALMAASSAAFAGRLAYAVINRSGAYDRATAGLPLMWHVAWAVARWAAGTHAMAIDPSAVVVRTRPDVLLRAPIGLTGLQRYFRHGRDGAHLFLSQDVREGLHWWAQSE